MFPKPKKDKKKRKSNSAKNIFLHLPPKIAKPSRGIPKELLEDTYVRDRGKCQLCRFLYGRNRYGNEPHHVISARGHGRRKVHRKENIFWSCGECHRRTHDDPKQSEALQAAWEDISRRLYGDIVDRIKRGELTAYDE